MSVGQRLQAELVREGFDPHWRQHPGNTKGGWLLPLPILAEQKASDYDSW
jgi:hypothetical protein